ncbi:MAG: GGDEF domain-containing protein [Gammaproteobacteria bacterium]|nr:GGDEF domain-containing protein [Gammaproteobacteria bacterium]
MPGRGYFFSFIAIFSLLMGGSFATSTVLITSNLISTKQIQQKSLIEQLAISNLNDDAKLLSKQLKSAIQFEFLTIKDTNNNILYRYIKDEKQLPHMTKVLKHFNLHPPVQRVKTNPGKLVIEFQPSYELILLPMSLITLIAFVAPITLCLFVYVLTGSIMDRRLEKVTKHLERLTEGANDEITPALKKHQIKPFENVISNITLLKEQPVPKTDPNVDTLTGLATGLKFVNDFNEALDKLDFNAPSTPTFIIIRALDLQEINLTQGYQQGDAYILDLAKHLKSYFASKGTELFKLNGLDFGAIVSIPGDLQNTTEEISQVLNSQMENAHTSYRVKIVPIKIEATTQLEQLFSQADRAASE